MVSVPENGVTCQYLIKNGRVESQEFDKAKT